MGGNMKAPECVKENCMLFVADEDACVVRTIPASLRLINESINTLREVLTPKPIFQEPKRKIY